MNWKPSPGFKYFPNWKAAFRIPLESQYILNWNSHLLVHADITGGWYGGIDGGGLYSYTTDPTTASPYWLDLPANNGGKHWFTLKKIDMSDLKTIKFTTYLFGSGSFDITVGLRNDHWGSFIKSKTQYVYNSTSTDIILDVSDVSGDYYIAFYYTGTSSTVRLNGVYISTT